MTRKILITGVAGFIGYHVCHKLLQEDYDIIGFDNLNSYYDIHLKNDRIKALDNLANTLSKTWKFIKGDLANYELLDNLFEINKFDIIIHLAAQAGVRYSLKNPKEYINSNIIGFQNILECCRNNPVKNLLYASSSSVYGGNAKVPFSEQDPVNHPVSLYAATKKSNELMAHSYSHLFGIPSMGLRFFTVYGPWGRPDMAPMIFTKAIVEKKPIKIYNHGNMFRDFTYIGDIVETIYRLIDKPAKPNPNFNKFSPDPATSWSSHMLFNIGNSNSIPLLTFISTLESELGIEAIKEFEDMQPGDVERTSADTKAVETWTGFRPNTNLKYGIANFVDWYMKYYNYTKN